MHRIIVTVSAGLIVGLFTGNLIAQSSLFRLKTALTTKLVTVDQKIIETYEINYLLDNSSCILLIRDTETKQIAITQVNKASCNGLKTEVTP